MHLLREAPAPQDVGSAKPRAVRAKHTLNDGGFHWSCQTCDGMTQLDQHTSRGSHVATVALDALAAGGCRTPGCWLHRLASCQSPPRRRVRQILRVRHGKTAQPQQTDHNRAARRAQTRHRPPGHLAASTECLAACSRAPARAQVAPYGLRGGSQRRPQPQTAPERADPARPAPPRPATRNHANRWSKHSLWDDLEPVGWWLRPPGTRSAAGRASARCARRMLRELQIPITGQNALPGADRHARKRSVPKGWDEESCPRAAKNAAARNLVYLAPSHRAESTQCAHPPTTITGRLRGRVAHTAVTQLTTIPHCGRHTCTDRW